MKATGAARTEIDIVDYSVIVDTALKGKTGYLGVTERGEVGRLYDIGSWEQFQLELGGLVAGNDFPLYCYRALRAKGRIVVVPAGRYVNPTDKSTLDGVKAFKTISQATTAAAGATADIVASGAAGSTGTVSVIVKRPGMTDVVIASAVAITAADTPTVQGAAIIAAINAGTGVHGYSAAANAGTVTITAPAALGAWGRKLQASVLPSDSGILFNNYLVQFSGGNDALTNAAEATFTAKGIRSGYNKVYVRAALSRSNNPNTYDVFVGITDGTVPEEEYADVPKLGSDAGMSDAIANILSNSRLLGSVSIDADFTFQPFSHSLAGGTDGVALTAADYMGNPSQQTNIHAFDQNTDITKICIPDMADGELAKYLADYVDSRKDLMGTHRTPINLSPDRVVEYRLGKGVYNHLPIDSWRNLMFTGDIEVTDPRNNAKRTISAIGDITGIIAAKDNSNGEWWSFAGDERGLLSNVHEVHNNVGSTAWQPYADDYDKNGIIPVVKDAARKVMIDGNVTLYNHDTLLKKAEVAELLTFMYRTLRTLVPKNYNPNDPETWKGTYRRVQPFLEYLKRGRALWDYSYQGDQDIVDVSKAVVNASPNGTSIDSGMYKFILGIKPKVAMKYIYVTIAVTNSGVSFETLQEAA